MTRCLLALLKTTFHSTELKQRGKGGIKPNPTDEGWWRSSGKKDDRLDCKVAQTSLPVSA